MIVVFGIELPPPDPEPPITDDLAVVDPRKNITCLGGHSLAGWNLGPVPFLAKTIQELCAHPLYGGNNISGPNLLGYCHDGDVFFGLDNRMLAPPGANTLFAHVWGTINVDAYDFVQFSMSARNFLECRNRCFCNYGLEDPFQQPRQVATTRKTIDQPGATRQYSVALDRYPAHPYSAIKPATRLYFLKKTPSVNLNNPGPPALSYVHQDVGLAADNKPICEGPLPTFALPYPFDIHEFGSNQALCATQLAGGKPAANAGAYCHMVPLAESPALLGDMPRVISFADDQTPRWDWTWSPGSGAAFFDVAALRFHCWKNCLCPRPPKSRNYLDPMQGMWEWMMENMPRNSVATNRGSKYPMGSSTDANGIIRTKYRGGTSTSQRCAATPDEPGSCEIPWPVEILGPVPNAVKRLPPSQPQSPAVEAWSQKGTCGNKCSGMRDCGEGCLCRMPSMEEVRASGVDPVMPAALCLGLGSVFGRDLGILEEQVECLCNATYVAPACCHSRDGVIWFQ